MLYVSAHIVYNRVVYFIFFRGRTIYTKRFNFFSEVMKVSKSLKIPRKSNVRFRINGLFQS